MPFFAACGYIFNLVVAKQAPKNIAKSAFSTRRSAGFYKVSVPRLNLGEYGFLAPGAVASANTASQGKIYTFRIVE